MIDRIKGVCSYILDSKLLYLALGYLFFLGILWFIEDFFFINFIYFLGFNIFLLIISGILGLKNLFILLLSFLLVIFRIFMYLSWEQKVQSVLDENLDLDVTLEGFISVEPDYGHQDVSLVFNVKKVNGNFLKGKEPLVTVKTLRYPERRLGEYCIVKGRLGKIENFTEDFDYKAFMRNKKIFYNMRVYSLDCTLDREGGLILYNRLYSLKKELVSRVEKALPEPQASLLIGIILGEERVFEESFEESLRVSGTTHIVAASGYNITLIFLMVDKGLRFINKRVRSILSILFIWLFVLISGVSVSIVRAAIMGTLTIMAGIWGYRSKVHNILPITTWVYALINPRIIYNIGFQLSLLATLGLIYVMPVFLSIRKSFLDDEKSEINSLVEIFFSTFACTLSTLPVTINTFGVFSVISILCNLLLLPVLDLTMFVGLVGIILVYILGILGEIVLLVAWVQLKYFELVVRFFGGLEWVVFEVEKGRSLISFLILVLLVILVLKFYPIDEENYYFNK